MSSDCITIPDLAIHLPSGFGSAYSAFNLPQSPACAITLSLRIDLHDGIIQGDDDTMLGLGVNYSTVNKQIYALVTSASTPATPRQWDGHEELMRQVAAIPLALEAVKGVQVGLTLDRASLYAKSVVYTLYFNAVEQGDREGAERVEGDGSSVECRDIDVICIIGLHPHERRDRQRLICDLKVEPDVPGLSTQGLVADAVEYLEQSNFGTIESLSHSLAEHLMKRLANHTTPSTLTLSLRKPSAQPFAVPGVTIYRSVPAHTPPETAQTPHSAESATAPRVFLALGSNIEPRLAHIQRAVRSLQSSGCTLVGTGKLYESEPMYHTDQSRFLNSAIEIRTALDPMELLRLLKRVEKEVGREKTFENGPRVVDVDLIYYGEESRKDGKKGDPEVDGVGWLQVPHWGRCEREFVLRPLCDIDPTFVDPSLRLPLASLLARLPSFPPQLAPVIPFPSPSPLIRLEPSATPLIMSIFNATPDSFSDGAASRLAVDSALSEVAALFDQPFPPAILDIGGMSTRPGSEPCTEQEELDRVVPLIRAIRASQASWSAIPISVDTYRASVARAAVEAGASSINDVRGGKEEGMLQTMSELDVPVFLMHSRGDSSSMTTSAMQDYGSLGVVEGVRREMVSMVQRALDAGVKRWNIVLDPGLGFAKSAQDSLVLLRHLEQLTAKGTELYGLPVLVGASRKGFVGKTIQRDVPKERGYGDAAVASWCAAKKVDVIRVHDVRAAGEVLAMHRAIAQAESGV